jgi:hypothetical protein
VTATCLIVTGMPGAGKSTVNRLVVSGRVGPISEPADEAARQLELCNRNLCALAGNFADAGFTPVIDWIIPDRDQLDLFVKLLAPRPIQFVVLAPGIGVCRYRNTIRDPRERFYFDGYEKLDADMRRELGDTGWWFDTSTLTPEETADRILREGPGRASIR